MKKIICIMLFLSLFQNQAFPQEAIERLKEKGIEIGLQLPQTPEVLEEEKAKSFEISPLKTILLTAPSYRISCNSNYSVYASKDGIIAVYDWKNKTIVFEDRFSKNAIYSVAFHPSQNIICFGNMEGGIVIFDLDKKETIHTLYETGKRISDVKFSPNGAFLAVSDLGTGEISIYDAKTYKKSETIKSHPEGIYYLAFSPDSKLIASGSRDKKVGITSLGQKWPSQILGEHKFLVLSLDFSSDNRFLASGGADGKLIVWEKNGDSINKTPYFVWIHGNWVTSVKFFKNYLVTGSKDGKVRIFDFENKKFLGNFKGVENIFSVDITPEGEYLFVASKEILIYDFKRILDKVK